MAKSTYKLDLKNSYRFFSNNVRIDKELYEKQLEKERLILAEKRRKDVLIRTIAKAKEDAKYPNRFIKYSAKAGLFCVIVLKWFFKQLEKIAKSMHEAEERQKLNKSKRPRLMHGIQKKKEREVLYKEKNQKENKEEVIPPFGFQRWR